MGTTADHRQKPQTPTHRLIDHILQAKTNGNLRQFILRARAEGISWRRLARQVEDITGEEITEVAIQSWFADDDEVRNAKPATTAR